MTIKHRRHGTAEYRAWHNMKTRCLCPTAQAWKDYGGRGITVHPEWAADFLAFLEHIGPRPSRHYSLDRIDNGRGYIPGNVRWATREQQMRNRRSNRRLTVAGDSACLVDHAGRFGVIPETVAYRLKAGHSAEIALAAPPGSLPRRRVVQSNHRLNPERVIALRQMHAAGVAISAIATRFGISRSNAWCVATRKTWGHVA